jgi:uncharacterized protein (DUF1697 family)
LTAYVALLRAVNVGGTGKLPMAELRAMGEGLGFANVRTFIASGNVVFGSDMGAVEVKAALETELAAYAGKPVGVMIRTGPEMARVLIDNPFTDHAPSRVVAIFLDAPPPLDTLSAVTHVADETIALGLREIYVSYGSGMADSKLKIPAAKAGTARNMNTVAKLAAMALDEGG